MPFTFIIRLHPVRQYSSKLNIRRGRLCNTIRAAVVSYTKIGANFINTKMCENWAQKLFGTQRAKMMVGREKIT
jgi:hypothetical protein